MTSRDFAYWLQGFFELAEPKGGLTEDQARCIQKHLAMVFVHEIDPSMGDEEHQAVLDEIHGMDTDQEVKLKQDPKRTRKTQNLTRFKC